MHPITATELEILKLLWQRTPQTGRELHDQLALTLAWSYSSTRKTLERMVEKKLLRQESQGHQNCFHANVDKISTLASITADFARRVLELDSPLPLAMFSDSKLLSHAEQHALHQQLALLQDEPSTEPSPEIDAQRTQSAEATAALTVALTVEPASEQKAELKAELKHSADAPQHSATNQSRP